MQNLKKPQERQRRLEEIPEVHSDPKMDPSYESEEEEEEADDRKQENFLRPRGSFTQQGKNTFSPQKGGSGTSRELGRSLSSKGLSNDSENTNLTREKNRDTASRKRIDDHEPSTTQDMLKGPFISLSSGGNGNRNAYSTISSESGVDLEYFQATPSSVSYQTTATINESDKIWHYKDPSGKIQGPFSLVQLRKWNSTGYFPADLVIWKIGEYEDDGILLVDALAGKFWKETELNDNQLKLTHQWPAVNGSMASSSSPSRTSMFGRPSLSVDMNNVGARNSGYNTRNDFTNLPSPTPGQISAASAEGRAFVNRISSSSQSVASSGTLFADNIQLDRIPSTSPAVNAYQATYNQQTISPGYHALQPDIPNPRNESSYFVGSSMIGPVTQQNFSQVPGPAPNLYSQWGNNATAVGADNPGGSFQNNGFSGMQASTTMRQLPSLSMTPQPILQANMGWVAAHPNANVSWTTTPPQVNNPSWAVQGTVASAGRVAQPDSWVPSGNGTTPGYMAPGSSQVGGFMNHGWTGPNGIESYERTRNENSSRPWQQQRGESRSRVCEFYMNGRCNRGSSCNWVHPQ